MSCILLDCEAHVSEFVINCDNVRVSEACV